MIIPRRDRERSGVFCGILLAILPLGPVPAPFVSGQDEAGARRKIDQRIREVVEARAAIQSRTKRESTVPGTERRTVSLLGIDRHFLLHLPDGDEMPEEAPLPLVVVLHGAFIDGPITEELTEFSRLADRERFVVVYPEANPQGGVGLWEFWSPPVENPGRGKPGQRRMTHGRDDVGFLTTMVDTLIEEGIADRRRVYFSGISNGAFMANRMAIDWGDRIAAIAPVAGTGLKLSAWILKPKRAMPVIYFHGTEDTIVGIDGSDAFSGGKNSQSAEEFCRWWAAHNVCRSQTAAADSLPDVKRDDGTTVERLTWEAGEKGAPVVFYRIAGGGHTWPGGSERQPEDNLGKICLDIEATPVIWEFFSKHSLP